MCVHPSNGSDSPVSPGLLISLCHEALAEKYRPITTEALRRLTRELEVIISLGYADYFLIVWDIVRWCRSHGIPTVGRGSAAGSLVSYLLGITPVDPLKHDLLFERFLNPSRQEPPDIDLDLCWKRRDEVIAYVYERYGRDRVAMVSTYITYTLRSALRDVARAFGLSDREASRLSDPLPFPYGSASTEDGDRARAVEKDPRYREIFEVALRLVGRPRHMGIHPGGIVIAPEPITRFVPLQPSAKGPVVTQFDMHGVEAMGLLKIDLLGQRSLTVVAEMARALREKYGVRFDPHTVPPLDEQTRALIRSGQTMGVFQIESPGMRGLLKKLMVETLEMLIAATSVIRPGPADSGMLRKFILRHHGLESVETVHPAMAEVLKGTYGIMLYQEDVIRVAEVVAGWSLAESDKLRRSMSGKRVEEPFMEHRDRFIRDAVAHGVSVEAACEVWRQMEAFSGYAFCKAHSAAYAAVSIQCAWLKAHYPAEFLAAVMSNYGGFYHTSCYLEEARRLGIAILPPDVNDGESGFTATDDAMPAIRIGLLQVKQVTRAVLDRLLEERKRRPFESLEDFCLRVKPSVREAENLIRCGAFDSFGSSRPHHLWRLRLLAHRLGGTDAPLFPRAIRLPASAGIPPGVDYPLDVKLRDELELMELTVEKHPLWIWREALRRLKEKTGPFCRAAELESHAGKRVTMVGWMITTRRARTRGDEVMQFLSCEDLTSTFECVLFPNVLRRYGRLIRARGPYIVTGSAEDDLGHVTLRVDQLTALSGGPPLPPPLDEEPSGASRSVVPAVARR